MLVKISAWIDKYHLVKKGDKLLLACSGGPDSLVLVHSLYALCSKYNISLAVAHVDHMFRGQDSAEDAEFVAAFCSQLGLPCYQTAINVPEYIVISGRSPQDAARELRYQFLQQTANRLGITKIATGHHRDDQAETVLMNLLRGTGSTGIRGIRPAHDNIIRPLLGVSRQEIDQYCLEQGLTPRQDSSNLKTDYLRNRVRLKLLPDLQQHYNHTIKDALCRTAELIGSEHDFICQNVRELWPQIVLDEQDVIRISRAGLSNLHIAQQREILRQAIEKKQGHTRGITFKHVEKFIEMALTGQVGSILELPGNLQVRVDYHDVELYSAHSHPVIPVRVAPLEIQLPGVTDVPELELTIVAELRDSAPEKLPTHSAVFDWVELSPPLYIRTRLDGDKFQPKGLKGNKKIKDFFIDAKIPRKKREITPIIYDEKGILWVGGYRQAERGDVTMKTQQFLQLTLHMGRNKID
ncbi:tRNA(Ile)-lysidine synthase [Sporomusaceae bacterium FL31]|nr:tRNA(Ile)-lysidine synthase [Sporomusaceae bacterium FL31]GCE34794.1 tRNA(Ile)-lysidine synthase [Sporomusaceae bacterium]